MLINDFCKNNFIDFKSLNFKLPIVRELTDSQTNCSCKNFLYSTDSGKMVKLYSRWNEGCSSKLSTLVYDIDHLTYGFNGETLI